jgi:hypothetical protein
MFATVVDVKSRWLTGEVPATDAQILTLIGDAEDIILGEFPTIDADVASNVVPATRVVRVVARMIHRVLRNPEGVRTVQESTGPFGGSTTFGGDNPGELYLTDDDRRDIGGRKTKGKAFTVSTIPTAWGGW